MEGGRRFRWGMPLLLVFILLCYAGYRYRWIVPALRPNPHGRPFTPEGLDVDFEVDGVRKQVVVTAYNYEAYSIEISLQETTWNEAPVRGPLPKNVSLPPYSSRTWRFDPPDPRVAEYGDAVEVKYSYAYGQGQGGGGATASGVGGPPGLRNSGTALALFTMEFDRPIEVRNVRVTLGKVVSKLEGQHLIRPGGELLIGKGKVGPAGRYKVVFEYRLTPWSPWHTHTYGL